MALTPDDVANLVALRQALHHLPEVSRHERRTAQQVLAALTPLGPDQIVTDLGGHGLAAVFDGAMAGPTVMLRAELDALPIHEANDVPHRSSIDGVAHLCGHDGHSAILLGMATLLARQRPAKGRVVLMFQPAEEDGSGAQAVLADPRFAALHPDWAFALHNMPGLPLGQIQLSPGPANCASCGLRIRLLGRTAHAATPQTGLSPEGAMVDLLAALKTLGTGGALQPGFRLVTPTHARLGLPTFGISPGEAEVWVTLRSLTDADMADLKSTAETTARTIATAHRLGIEMSWHDDFAACVNAPEATAQAHAAFVTAGISVEQTDGPMRASEDFGRFSQCGARSAMFLLGSGVECAALHDPRYDFPDALIKAGVDAFDAILTRLLGSSVL